MIIKTFARQSLYPMNQYMIFVYYKSPNNLPNDQRRIYSITKRSNKSIKEEQMSFLHCGCSLLQGLSPVQVEEDDP